MQPSRSSPISAKGGSRKAPSGADPREGLVPARTEWAGQGSNLRHRPCKGRALPTELPARRARLGYSRSRRLATRGSAETTCSTCAERPSCVVRSAHRVRSGRGDGSRRIGRRRAPRRCRSAWQSRSASCEVRPARFAYRCPCPRYYTPRSERAARSNATSRVSCRSWHVATPPSASVAQFHTQASSTCPGSGECTDAKPFSPSKSESTRIGTGSPWTSTTFWRSPRWRVSIA